MNRRDISLKSATLISDPGGALTPKYARFPIVTANVARPGRRAAIMSVETGVDAPNDEMAQHVTRSAPRLRAAYAQVVQRCAQSITGDAAPDIEALVADLQTATDRILGRGGARLLIGTVLIV